MSAPGTIWLWEAAGLSGTAGDPVAAMAAAGPYLSADGEGLAEEAVMEMIPADFGGSVPGHKRTGLAYRGRLRCGAPDWEKVAEPSPGAS